MTRRMKKQESEGELNLAPIMNLVMILIPLLLLSVVFEQVGVIDVLNNRGVHLQTPINEILKEPPGLTIGVTPEGFNVGLGGERLAPVNGCPVNGPTVCVKGAVNVHLKASAELRTLYDASPSPERRELLARSDKALEVAVAQYDWRRLYNTLITIKQRYPEESVVKVRADADMPFEMLIKTMDTARFKLNSDEEDGVFSSDDVFAAAEQQEEGARQGFAELFHQVTLVPFI